MADTICHATQGGLMLLAPFITRVRKRSLLWILAFVGGVVGALPDLLGAYGNVVCQDTWALYNEGHFGGIAGLLQYVPMYWLHLFVDSVTHGPGARWWLWEERLWVELMLWVVNAPVISWMIMVWRRGKLPDKKQESSGLQGSFR